MLSSTWPQRHGGYFEIPIDTLDPLTLLPTQFRFDSLVCVSLFLSLGTLKHFCFHPITHYAVESACWFQSRSLALMLSMELIWKVNQPLPQGE